MQPIASTRHTIILLAILATLSAMTFAANSTPSAAHPNRLGLYASVIAAELMLARYVAIGARIPLRELIGKVCWFDPLIAAALWIGAGFAAAVVKTALGAVNDRTRGLLPTNMPEKVGWICVSLVAGFVEELIFRGYLQRQFAAWTRNTAAAIALQAIAFGASHGYQGIRSMVAVAVYGALFGLLAHLRRGLAPGMLAHAWTDIIGGVLRR